MDEQEKPRGVSAGQLRRVRRHEKSLRELRRLLADPDCPAEVLRSFGGKAAALERYYTSGAWKQDYADEEAGLFPRDLPRGVLSEDGIWNALEEYRERLEEQRSSSAENS